MLEGKVIGADNESELELFKSVNFTNALVLKINQLAKQVKFTKIQNCEIWIGVKMICYQFSSLKWHIAIRHVYIFKNSVTKLIFPL
jgi:hypothetical protein